MRQQNERSSSESYFWPAVWAVALHALMFAMLFVSFAMTPDLPPARPIVQATLYQLKSQSQAKVQTTQKIAGEAKKTSAPTHQTEQLEQKKAEEQKQAAKAAEQKKAAEARKTEEVKKAAEAKKVEEKKKAAEQKKVADIAKKKAAEEAKKKAAEEAKKKALAEAKKKAAEEAKKKAAAEAAKKQKVAEEAKRKATEDKKAQALAELLSEDTQHQQALADEVGDQVAGDLDDLIVKLVSEQWRQPPSARNGMSVEVLIEMLPDGTITNAHVTRSSGDIPFDNSAVAAVRNVGRIAEMQQLDRATFDAKYRQRRVIFKPEDLSL